MSTPYPSRCFSEPKLLERVDPVLWPQSEPEDKVNSDPASTGHSKRHSLTKEQLDHFNENGYVVLRQVFNPSDVDTQLNEMQQMKKSFVKNPGSIGHFITEKDDPTVLRSIFEVHKHSEVFNQLSRDRRLVDRVRSILQDDVYVMQSRINLQPPFTGSGFYWHSDFETWHMEDGMPRMRACSALIMGDKNRSANSALMVIPKTHKTFVSCIGETPEDNWKQSLKKQYIGVPDPTVIRKMADEHGIVYCEGNPGDVLLFDCNLLHASHSNVSPWPRRNAFFVYNSLSNKLQEPFDSTARVPRPEHIATRDPEWVRPIQPLDIVN